SARIEMGDTHVLVGATLENRVPPFLLNSNKGWATAEYSMLPCATPTRSRRDVSIGRPSGRSSEIQRLIGRSLRSVLNLKAMPDRTLNIDCDVIQADGVTRKASINGAYVAATQALAGAFLQGDVQDWPLVAQVAAVSVGIVDGHRLLDLDAPEDQSADVDMNIVATSTGRLIEIQGTGEEYTFSREDLDRLVDLALGGINRLVEHQSVAVAAMVDEVEAARNGGSRQTAEPKNEAELWGKPEK
ncbi:MAG: ribonuclease PH, partial [Acidobacteriota bacterium]